MKERLRIFALSLGLSFGILVVFINSLEALAIVFVLVTASVVAASTSDLRELEKDRGLLFFAILVAAFTVGISYYASQVYADIFVPLVALNVAVLAGYLVMKKMPRYSRDADFR